MVNTIDQFFNFFFKKIASFFSNPLRHNPPHPTLHYNMSDPVAQKSMALSNLPHVKEAGFIKGGHLFKVKEGGAKRQWDYALCGREWFKISPQDEVVRWREEYTAIHSVEEDVENPKQFNCWVFKGGKRMGAGGYPALCCRALMCENEGDRGDWVATFRALLMNYWHERLELSLIPAPEVYQYHLFVLRHSDPAHAPHLLALSTTRIRLVLLRTPTDSTALIEAPFTEVKGVIRSSSQAKLLGVKTPSGEVWGGGKKGRKG